MKNLSSESGGIVGMYAPLISEISMNENLHLVGLVPNENLGRSYNFPIMKVGPPSRLPFPKTLESLLYNHWFFPKALKRIKADIFLSPYFDVSFNKSIISLITIHDMCFFEVPKKYGFLRRTYFQSRTKKSARNATIILTDSQTSKGCIRDLLRIPESKIRVIQNQLDPVFRDFNPSLDDIKFFKSKNSIPEYAKILLYSSGFENRKNINNLLKSADEAITKGYFDKVMITGGNLERWKKALSDFHLEESNFIFTGQLDSKEMKLAYLISSAMIFPSHSEGFGRPNMEAMAVGIPIACSDIPVFREFCEDYPAYFDPNSITSIVSALSKVSSQNVLPPRFLSQYGLNTQELIDLIENVIMNREC